jgi:hypothetical protein
VNALTSWWNTASSYAASSVTTEICGAALGLLLLVVIWQGLKRAGAGAKRAGASVTKQADGTLLTYVVAGMATSTSAEAMWNFFHHTLHINNIAARVAMFSMYETSMLVCALRARQAVSKGGSAGVEGAAVWVLASLSGILASTAETTFGGGLARLAAPLIAAFLWERGLTQERKRVGKKTINWRLGPERLLVWLGLADAKDRSVSEVDAHRRLTRTARAAMRVRDLEETGVEDGRELLRARRRLRRTMERAVEHAGLTEQPARQTALLRQIAALSNAQGLARLSLPAPWAPPAAPPPALHVTMLTPLAFMPRPHDPDPTPDGDGDRAPASDTRAALTVPVRPIVLPAPDNGHGVRPVPALVRSYGMSDWTLESLRRPEDKSGRRPEDKTGQRIDRNAFFLALDNNDGLVDRAIAELTQAGVKAPTRGYGYTLRRKWLEQKAQANGHLTRVK